MNHNAALFSSLQEKYDRTTENEFIFIFFLLHYLFSAFLPSFSCNIGFLSLNTADI